MAQGTDFKPSILRFLGGMGTAAAVLGAAPVFANVKQGVDAWSSGNYTAAVAEWQQPASNGDADALFNLAQAYRLGRGVPADINRARELYAEAAQKGHVKAADNYGLLLFQQGEQASAMPLIKDAAERGDPRAQYVLGLAHFNADYAQKDWVRAYALLTLANGAGLPQAANALAQMDAYVPIEQRQVAQSVARELEANAAQRRTAELAALDLGSTGGTFPAPATSPSPQPRPAFVERAPRGGSVEAAQVSATPAVVSAPAPQPVRVAQPVASSPAPSTARNGNWRVQLGAFGVKANADRLWSTLQSNPALSGTSKALVPGGNVTRLQAVGFYSRAEAQRACDSLKREGQGCLVKQP
ncbi:sporulation protein [Erythrobacter longus]|uniref:Sporulation protein n=1 Tax=Erythrobacter longus TaxID=1044 RepID=A0A074MA17_ERYLO|nr:SPOR domain-containing protein [Erythrobacter longus]KEO90269.1 sporulation protein [Erythrobacter longus]